MDEEQMAERLVKNETKLEAMARACERCWDSVIPSIEQRLRNVETKLAMFCGGLALLQIFVGVFLAHYLKR